MNALNESFFQLIEENKGILYKISRSYCRDEDDRKDLEQEIIIQLWKSFSKYDERYKWSTWMYRIALNVSISFYRRETNRKRSTMPLDDAIIDKVGEDEQDHVEENVRNLYRFIGQLDEMNRAVMLLYLDDNSYKEIAFIMGITETNVATKIGRIKQKLKLQFSTIEG